jgi:hypothetical protein
MVDVPPNLGRDFVMSDRKTGTLKLKLKNQGNPSGSIGSNFPLHAQRIGAETAIAEYNVPTSYRHLEQVKMYAELIRNYKNHGIKSPWDNKLIPFIVDSHAVATEIYFLNEDYLKLYVHSDEDMRVQSFSQLEDKNAIKRRVLCMGNLLCTNRRFQAKLTDIKVV